MISSSEELFYSNIKTHQDELKNSGYDYNLKYNEKSGDNISSSKGRNKKRKRKIIWFNPP